MLERDNFWRSPWFVLAIMCFPSLYALYLWWIKPSNSNFTVAEQLETLLTLVVPAAIPFWITAAAWRIEPTRAVRWLTACVVVLGEVILGFLWLTRWWVVTVTSTNGSRKSVLLELFVLAIVLLIQGVFAVSSLLVALMTYQDRRWAAKYPTKSRMP